jgi:two-component system, chemotaxis family, sensor kinase CheA
MTDPYRYFRIEAHELTDELTAALSALARGGQTAPQVGSLLRHAHTLKGAARVVAQAGIADCAHALEELLEPYRGSSARIDFGHLDQMQALVGQISEALGELNPVPPSPRQPGDESAALAGGAGGVDQNAVEVHDEVTTVEQTARASLAEIDAVIDGASQVRGQLSLLRANVEQVMRLRARLHENPGPRPIDRLRKIATIDEAAEQVQRSLATCTDRMERELRQVYDTAERLRLVPVESIVPDLERGAHDVAAAQGKRVLVDVRGGRIRLDAPVLATAAAALRQIVRNAVAHGIEPPHERVAAGKAEVGLVRLNITQGGASVVFSCTDDGRGIDLSAVRRELEQAGTPAAHLPDEAVLELLTRGGLSTALTVSEISGRGIGLDVVRDAARQLGGRVSIRTVPGTGTTIDLTSSLSLTAQDVILLDAGQVVGLPLGAVREAIRVRGTEIHRNQWGESLIRDDVEIPFLPLAAALGDRTCTGRSLPSWSVLIIESPHGTAAIGVRRLVGSLGVAIHPIPALAAVPKLLGGVWIDIDGRPRLLIDADALVVAAGAAHDLDTRETAVHAPILIVDDSLTTRMLEQSILEAAGYQVELASSAEEGLELAASRPFSLVLVDVEMPGMDGFGFVAQTRARPELRHLPCILVTSRASEQDRRRGVEAGARGHLDKGQFIQGALLDRIAELLGG